MLKSFLGRWKLTSVIAKCGDVAIEPFSSNPHGTIIYSKDYVVVFISNGERKKFFDANDVSNNEKIDNFNNFEAYCGPYSIDNKANIVTHHLSYSKIPNAIGTTFKRYYKFSDNNNTLSLKTIDPIHIANKPPVKGGTWLFNLTWKKVK